ncbi:RNA methyltransferase [Georgenia wutianyii]|uniref:RNA methyltransferase n=1 Tax=Georgenia wutianyii TaxID=2585135 RepID=A0ABX5VMT6_9MICO|nr:RNA methyltransferase [Georgenia wutianyii]QDB79787.1 RNA methyltransferase [Georgenia wutianyii]
MTERPDLLTNPRSDRVAMVKRLSGRSARRRHGQFLVEGPQGVREVVRHAPERVRDLYLTEEAADRHPEILAEARVTVRHVHLATPEVLAAMSGDAQGALAVVRTEPDVALPAGPLRLVAVLPWAADPGNLGTIVRAADAAGADAVVLGPDSTDPHNPKVVRSTAGSLFHLPVVPVEDLVATTARLRVDGLQVLAAAADGEWDVDDLADAALAPVPDVVVPDLRRPTAWLFGNEAHGLRPEERDLADAVVRVPIHGLAESLNVATAATLCLYASARAQRRAPD